MKILLNAVSAKKRAGGGFQISVNFINASLSRNDIDWYYLVSKDIDRVISVEISKNCENKYFVMPTQPDFINSYCQVRDEISKIENLIKPDIVYSLTAPSYFKFKAPEVMRFTNPWVTNSNSFAKDSLGIFGKFRNYLYCLNQKRLLKKRKFFITQSTIIKRGILSVTNTNPEFVRVVPNVLPAIFNQNFSDQKFNIPNREGIVYISCVAAPVPHKNIDLIPSVLMVLKEKYGIQNVKFLVTIPEDHPFNTSLNKKIKKNRVEYGIYNYGYCSQEKLVELYSICDLCFIPTLLETFSASLLEAMYFNLAIVATDFEFNREVAGDSALYFKPLDANSAAEKIALLVKDEELKNALKAKMPIYFSNYFNYERHLDETISFLKSCVQTK